MASRMGVDWLPRETKGGPSLRSGKLEGGDRGNCPRRRELVMASKVCHRQMRLSLVYLGK